MFDFKEWCKKFGLHESTIQCLIEEAYVDQYTVPYLADKSLLSSLKNARGEEL